MIKADSCSLIYMAKAGMLGLVRDLYGGIRITDGVYDEVIVKGKEGGHPDAYMLDSEVGVGGISTVVFGGELPPRLSGLGRGERETIAEAREEECPALLDDVKSKIAASDLRVPYISTDMALVEALARDLIRTDEYESRVRTLSRVSGMRGERLAELIRIGRIIGGDAGEGRKHKARG